jgi:hypothetical protein
VASCLVSYVGNAFGLHNTYPFFRLQVSDVGKTHRFAPTTVILILMLNTFRNSVYYSRLFCIFII